MWTKAHRRGQNTKCCSAETGSRSSSSNMIARSDQIGHAVNLYAAGDKRLEVIQHRQMVVGDAPGCFAFRLAADPRSHQIEELMGMGATQHSLPLALLQIGIVAHESENERVVRMHVMMTTVAERSCSYMLRIAWKSTLRSSSLKPTFCARLALMNPLPTYSPYGMRLLRPIVRSSSSGCSLSHLAKSAEPTFSPLMELSVTAMRVIAMSIGRIGSTDRPKLSWTAPRTCPAFGPVESTAPKVRTS